jgi:uncharacterized protein YutD
LYHIGGNTYQLVKDHKNAWNFEVFRERYSEVLDRYDYIVGDWGYNQLRLKGFFKETNNKGAKEASISHLHDYLNEYCNFGCAYFIIEKQAAKKGQPGKEQDPDETVSEPEIIIAEKPDPEKQQDAAEIKPRVHYHRAGTETNRHRGISLQDRGSPTGGQNPGEAKPKGADSRPRDQEGRGHTDQRPKGQEQRSRDQETKSRSPEPNRQREHDPRQRDSTQQRAREQEPRGRDTEQRQREPGQQNYRDGERRGPKEQSGRNRDQDTKGKPQQQNQHAQENRGKGPNPGRNKGQDRNRSHNRDRSREQDKEKAEPLA